MVQFANDLRLTMRSLRRDWRFALAFIVPLALGLGAGATFYSIIDHVLYRPPPGVRDPGSLVRIGISNKQFPDPFRAGNVSTSWLDIQALRRSTAFSSVAGFITYRAALGTGPEARRIPAMLATASYFEVVGVRPQRGRFYTPDEDATTASRVPCVAGDRFWRSQLGGSDDAIGRRLQIGRLECEVVGVAPRGFNGTGYSQVDLWLPLRASGEASHGDTALWNSDGSHWIRLIARPREGATAAELNREATLAYRSVAGRKRDPKLENSMLTEPLMGAPSTATSQRMRTAGWLAGGAAALVLLVGANLVNLLVARNLGRTRETAIRLALGGSRARLFAHQVLESAVLAVLAGSLSLLIVRWASPVVRTVLFPGTSWADGPITGRIVAAAIIASLLVGGAIAAVAGWYASHVDPQAALATALLIASAGFVRSFRAAAGSSLGFEMNGLIFAEIPNLDAAIPEATAQREFMLELRDRVSALPGVETASLAYNTPWYYNRNETLREPGRDSLPLIPGYGWPAFDAVTPGHLANMRLSMRAGRWLSESDDAGAMPVMVVSSSMAKLYWGPDRAALGHCLFVGKEPVCRGVVGVVDDIRFTGGLDATHTPSYYLTVAQTAAHQAPSKLFVRAKRDAASLIPELRRLMQGARPALPPADVHLMQDHLDPLLAAWRLGATAYTALGVLSALIAMLGLFSVMAYLVTERRKEFAIRSALGARTAQLVAPVLRQSVSVVSAGSIAGLLVAWRSEKWLQPQLYHSRLLEPVVVAAVVAALILVAVAAVTGPPRRAATLDPIDALRAE